MPATVDEAQVDGHPVLVLRAAGGELEAAFAVKVGMIGCSLRHRGQELLGQRGGLDRYARTGSSMGIPLLHPWANRLSGLRYSACGRDVAIDPDAMPVRLDPNGLPIHGVLAASPHWEAVEAGERGGAARLIARLDFASRPELLAAFPFPHAIEQEVTVDDARLSVATTLRANGEAEVPVSFGYHPYLQLPEVPREEWEVTLPLLRHACVDDRGIPTGEHQPVEPGTAPLGHRTFDDLFDELADPPQFALAGPGRTIRLSFEEGYDHAQVYAPPGESFICFEPMTAPTDALVSGTGLRTVKPGDAYAARFSIAVQSV